MKKHRLVPCLFAAIFVLLAVPAQTREKITIAVLDFEAKNVPIESAEAVSDLLRTELFNTGNFTVVERQRIQKVLEEQKFQMSGATDTDQMAQIGRLLNVKKIMIGTVTKLGNNIINTRIVDVQSGQVELAEAVESRGGDENFPKAVTELALRISYKVGLEGSIVRITGETVYIDLGSTDGVQPGQLFSVIRAGETITDLEGRVIGTKTETIGYLSVAKVQDRFSETAVKESAAAFQKGDKVQPADASASLPKARKPAVKTEPPKPGPKTEQPESDKKPIDVPPTF